MIILRRRDAMRLVGLRSTAFDQLRKTSDFPAAIRVTRRTPGWPEHEVIEWLERRREPKGKGGAS